LPLGPLDDLNFGLITHAALSASKMEKVYT
jgi:hypothetical protein